MIGLHYIYEIPVVVFVGYLLELIIGYGFNWHPIMFIGNMISFFEKKLRKAFPNTEKGERRAGFFLVIIIVFLSTVIPAAILAVCFWIHRILGMTVEILMCYSIFATHSLKKESMKVYKALENDGLEAGQKAVAMIVGRDTNVLDEKGVVKATVETIAENSADGIIAPLIYMVIGGPVLGFFYKAINTMDSMVAYKNDKYINFGRTAAILDDIANFVPSRLAGIFMIISSSFAGFNMKNAAKIWRRDRFKHASPNSAQTEAVMAGALEVQLAGDAQYFNKVYKKPFIGDPIRPIEVEDIVRANKLLYFTCTFGTILLAGLRALIEFLVMTFLI